MFAVGRNDDPTFLGTHQTACGHLMKLHGFRGRRGGRDDARLGGTVVVHGAEYRGHRAVWGGLGPLVGDGYRRCLLGGVDSCAEQPASNDSATAAGMTIFTFS